MIKFDEMDYLNTALANFGTDLEARARFLQGLHFAVIYPELSKKISTLTKEQDIISRGCLSLFQEMEMIKEQSAIYQK